MSALKTLELNEIQGYSLMKTIIIGKWFMLLNSLLTHENGKRDGVNFVNPISKRKLRRELRAAHVRLTVFKLFAVSYGPSCRQKR